MNSRLSLRYFAASLGVLLVMCSSLYGLQPLPMSYYRYTIMWQDNHYVLTLKNVIPPKKRPLKAAAVDKLLQSLSKPSKNNWSVPSSRADWLAQNAQVALNEYVADNYLKEVLPGQKSLFIKAFKDYWKKSHKGIKWNPNMWTDYESALGLSIAITDMSGNKYAITADNPYPVCVPWLISCKNGTSHFQTYCPRLTRYILNLTRLPDLFVEGKSEKILRKVIATNLIEHELAEQWSLSAFKSWLGIGYSLLKKHFRIYGSRVDSSLFSAQLFSISLPKNVVFSVALSINDSGVSSDGFYRSIRGHSACIESNKFFMKLIRDNPDLEFQVNYTDNTTFTAPFYKQFSQDHAIANLSPIDKRLSEKFKQSTLITVVKPGPVKHILSRWLLLPSKRTYLWFFKGSSLFKWPSGNIDFVDVVDRHLVMRFVTIDSLSRKKSSWFGARGS